MIWFDCKIAYLKELDKDKRKKVTESYLVEAFNFSQAEERISEEMANYISGEFTVSGLRKASINEIFPNDEGDRLYKCKVAFLNIDEVSGKEKRINANIIVYGTDIENALENLKKNMQDCMDVYVITSIAETPYIDIYPLDVPEETASKKDETSGIIDEIADLKDELDAIANREEEHEEDAF